MTLPHFIAITVAVTVVALIGVLWIAWTDWRRKRNDNA